MSNSDSNKKSQKYRWRHINKNDAPKTVQNLFKKYPEFMIIGENNTNGEEWVAYAVISEDNVIRTEKTHTSRKAAMADLKTIVENTRGQGTQVEKKSGKIRSFFGVRG